MTIDLRRAGTLVALLVCAATLRLVAQTPQQPAPPEITTGLIVGRAIDAGTGKPVGGAFVTLSTTGAATAVVPGAPPTLSRFPIRVVADSSGRFVFHDLPKGAFTLSANKAGYSPTAFGRSNATDTNSQPLILAEGERRGDVTLKFWKDVSLSGRVVDEAGEPAIGIQLKALRRVTSGGRLMFTLSGNTATTDDRGIYRIPALRPGDYVVVIVNTQTTVPVSLQEQLASPTGAQDLQRQLGSSSLLSILGGGNTSGQRVGSMVLSPGDRALAGPSPRGGRVFVYPTTYYPAATTASKATVLTLGSGDDRTAIDFHLRPVATFAISGTLAGLNGPEPYTMLTLAQANSGEIQRDFDVTAGQTTTDAAGAFTFLGVTPGAYTINGIKLPPRPVSTSSGFSTVIQTGTSTIYSGGSAPSTPPPIPDGPTLWAATPVNVADTDVTGVAVALSAGGRLTGHLEFVGAIDKPAADRLPQITIQIDTADGRETSTSLYTAERGVVDATGQFRTYQLPPGRYVLRANGAAPGWSFKSATLSGRDISDMPFELGRNDVDNIVVTFTDRPSELSGTARDSKGPDATATVLMFPALPALWLDHGPQPRRFKAVRAGSDGAYRVANVPPGDYLIVAVRTGMPSDWPNPALLQKLTTLATRVTIADGEKKSIDVETKEVR